MKKQFNPFKDITYIERDGRLFQLHWRYRFDPVTLMVAGTLAAAGGQVYSGMAANAEGKDAQKIQEYNARVNEQKAKAIEQKTAFDQRRQAEQSAREMSSLTAGIGASGATMSEGTPLLIASKQASELELENAMIGYEGGIAATQARNEASLNRLQGKFYRAQGKNRAIANYIGAGSSLLTGFGAAGAAGKASSAGSKGGNFVGVARI
jgi:hypothetical protein